MKRRDLIAGVGLGAAIAGTTAITQSTIHPSPSLVTEQAVFAEAGGMKLMTEFRMFASYYQFYVHDGDSEYCPESFYTEPDDRRTDIGSYRQGYLTNGRTIHFGTDADLNVHWVEVYLADHSPDFGKTERVIGLPLQVNSGKIVISVLFSEPDPTTEVALKPGTWTVYLLAFNLGSDQLFERREPRSDGNSEKDSKVLSDEQLKANWEFERYQIILVPGMQTPIGVLHGTANRRGT